MKQFDENGLTLVELLVTITIMGIIASAAIPLLSTSLDAHNRGISQGDRVKVFNDRGFLTIDVLLDFSIKPGCVAITNGWWISEGGTVNFLSLGRETDMGYGAAFHENLVEIERVD